MLHFTDLWHKANVDQPDTGSLTASLQCLDTDSPVLGGLPAFGDAAVALDCMLRVSHILHCLSN